MDPLNDPTFVRNLIAGDVTAFSTLFSSLKRKLPEFLVRSVGLSYSDAEEVASAVLFKVHESLSTFQPQSDAKLTTWIFEIAKHAGIDCKRKLSLTRDVKQITDHDGPRLSSAGEKRRNIKTPSQYEAEMLGQNDSISSKILPYKEAFEKLTEQDKDILRMAHVMTYAEISEVENAQVGALRTRHFRALKRVTELTRTGGEIDE